MTLPNTGSTPRYVENLRVGGGYASSPDGGADLDSAGNVAADGDLTLDGSLLVATDATVEGEFAVTGIDTTWRVSLSARTGWPSFTIGCSAPTQIEIGGSPRLNLYVMDFDKDIQEYGSWNVFLPEDYDGRSLLMRVYWTATAGTSGTVRFRPHCQCFDDGSSISDYASDGTVEDVFLGINKLHRFEKTLAPVNAGAGKLLIVGLRREAAVATDTFDADARVIGVELSYV